MNLIARGSMAFTALAVVLCLSGSARDAGAQAAPPPSLKDEAADPDVNLTAMLYAQIRPSGEILKRNDPGAVVKENLREALEQGGHFRIFTVSVTQPIINKAIKDRVLNPTDLNEPFQTEALERIARVLGTRYILTFQTSVDKTNLTTEIRFLESVGAMEWRTVLSNRFETPNSVGKRRLKPEEMALLNVDTIAASLNIPSHLSDSLHLEVKARTIPAPSDKTKQPGATPKPAPTEGPAQGVGQTADPGTALPTGNTADPGGSLVTDPRSVTPPGPKPDRPAPSSAGSPPTQKPTRTTPPVSPRNQPPPRGQAQQGKPANGKTPITNTTPDPRIVGAPSAAPGGPPAEIADYVSLASRYRQSGDTANVIFALRRAIDENPRDIKLRRELVEAYQERHLTESALAEIGRALTIAPDDSGLFQLTGDALYGKGDIPGAIKAYREATRLNPANIDAQVALGDTLLSDSQFADAMGAYETAAKADPKNPLPHRRLARAMASRASSDPALYTASIEEIKKARRLAGTGETQTYLGDYVSLMRLMESRLNDLLDELEGTYSAFRQGKKTRDEALRAVSDMKLRASAAADYLDNVPPAIGHDVTQAQYLQGVATVQEALGFLKAYLSSDHDMSLDEKLTIARIDARHALSAAGKRLPVSSPAARPNDTAGTH